jgi:very-short-patch-repair endonuclease
MELSAITPPPNLSPIGDWNMKVEPEITKALFEAVERPAGNYAESLGGLLRGFLEKCDSPIEQRLLCHLATMPLPFADVGLVHPMPWLVHKDAQFDPRGLYDTKGDFVIIAPQHVIGKYRVDFAILTSFSGRESKIVIECDGHDFHERTKEQAASDKARDRFMTAAGWKIFRFTGSEIFKDACGCSAEVECYLFELAYEAFKATREVAAANG